MADPAAPGRHQLLINGTHRPSESGRTHPVRDHRGTLIGEVALGSRRDVRDAVAAARAAVPGWLRTAPTTRAGMLFDVEHGMARRHEELRALVEASEGVGVKRAAQLVAAAADRWLHHAGWADKLTEPALGVVAVLAPASSSLLGLVSVLAPALATGNTVVVVAAQDRPLPALLVGEAASGLPAGVLGVLTGRTAELAPWLAAHPDVDGIDLVGAPAAQRQDLELGAAGTLTRIIGAGTEPDWTRTPEASSLRALLRTG
ncbi:MAG: aldehyde dehydrogenase family protein [Mycobacteriaceae bacterium]